MACDCGGCSGIFCGGVPRPARPLRERLEGRRKNPVVRPARKNGCAGPGAPRESGQDGRRGGRQCIRVKRTQRARGVRPEEAPAFRVCPAEFRRLAANSAAGALRVPVSRQVAPSHAYVPMIYCIGDETRAGTAAGASLASRRPFFIPYRPPIGRRGAALFFPPPARRG